MRVYEMIEKLSIMPAGAEVKFNTLMTLAEFAAGEQNVDDAGEVLYGVRKDVSDVERISDKCVYIYG